MLVEPEEKTLIKLMARYPEVIEGAVKSLEVHRLTFYLNELAGLFHSYYNKNKVITENTTINGRTIITGQHGQYRLRERLEYFGCQCAGKNVIQSKINKGLEMATGNIKKFELKLGRAGLIIVIVGFSALLCAFFLLGVTVGKNIDTYPEKIASLPQRVLALVWRPAKIKAQQNLTDHKTIPPNRLKRILT